MRWYVNDSSLQAQFIDGRSLEGILLELIAARARVQQLRQNLYTARSISNRLVAPSATFKNFIYTSRDHDLRRQVLIWLDRTGPFVDDDRASEIDDFFECFGLDVTDGGLGEAARRIKNGERSSTYSFPGGTRLFEASPLEVDHGLPEDRLGKYGIENFWSVPALVKSALEERPPPTTWEALVMAARERFPHLLIPDDVFTNPTLAREPFDSIIRERVLALLEHLNAYMADRNSTGSEGPAAREIVQKFFTGNRALFSGESQTNQTNFAQALTFSDPEDSKRKIFAHWHGKISHRYFRLHFEWPPPADASLLKILYLGPKLTKS